MNNVISISSLLIGILGVGIAIFQTINITKVKSLVLQQGLDLKSRLDHEYKSLSKLQNAISEKNEISWSDSKSEILSKISERSESMALIEDSLKLFICVTSGKKIDENE